MPIDLLFPTPVYRVVDENDFCSRSALLRSCLTVSRKDEVKNRAKNKYHRVNTSHLVDDRLHLNEEFSLLRRYVIRHARSFIKDLGYPSRSAEITQMWVNVGSKGDFVYPHTHPGNNTFLAGVYYVRCDTRDGISFHLPYDREPAEVVNPINTSSNYYEGQEGRLLLFRNDTIHSTFPQEGEERVVVSFNLKLTDSR